METRTYYFRGMVDRWGETKRRFVSHAGYSQNSPAGLPLYPWVTFGEAQDEARAGKFRAKLIRKKSEMELTNR